MVDLCSRSLKRSLYAGVEGKKGIKSSLKRNVREHLVSKQDAYTAGQHKVCESVCLRRGCRMRWNKSRDHLVRPSFFLTSMLFCDIRREEQRLLR
jgi:hypothetical protein